MLIDTPSGVARAWIYPTAESEVADLPGSNPPTGLLLLGHGAGGGVDAVDLSLVSQVALELRWVVGLIEQPYRVAGRRAPAPANQVDAAWLSVTAALRRRFRSGPLVCGGRSFGARVACRTWQETGCDGVLALAFPTHPPGRPAQSRQAELSAVQVPTLVVQGASDPFGQPEPPPLGEVVVVAGDHGLKKDHAAISAAVASYLSGLASS